MPFANAALIGTNGFTGVVGETDATASSFWTPGPDAGLATLGNTFTSSINYKAIGTGGDTTGMLTPSAPSTPDWISFTLTTDASAVELTSFSLVYYALEGTGGNQSQDAIATFTLSITGGSVNFTSSPFQITDASAGNSGGPVGGQGNSGTIDLTDAPVLAAGTVFTVTLTHGSPVLMGLDDFSISGLAVPEPSAALLSGFGILSLLRRRRYTGV